MKPVVSVIILSYNQTEYIIDAVESVIAQTFRKWEAIIIDNGSTDGTQQVLQRYAEDPRIRLIFHDTNGHITARSNQGVTLSKGDYISFLYSDDYYLPTKLEKQLTCFECLSADWGVVHGPGYGLNVFSGNQKLALCTPVNGFVLPDLFTRHAEGFINPISPLIRRECLLRYPFHEDLFTEGETIYYRIAMRYKFFYLDEPLVVMREHDRNMRFANKRTTLLLDELLMRLSQDAEFPTQSLPALYKFWGYAMGCNAWINVRSNMDAKWARKVFSKAVKADWRQFFKLKTFIGWLLTYLPNSFVNYINAMINLLNNRNKAIYLEDYYK
jgi:glycosyltransferase involved in cell wall biosynthesis